MDTKTLLAILIALVIGAGGGYALAANKTSDTNEHVAGGDVMKNDSMGMGGAMDDMMSGLNGKTGDEFDKAFLSEMISHHQGAVQMAEAALKDAKHQEIKDMANAIITAQTSEIKQMQDWEKGWYGEMPR